MCRLSINAWLCIILTLLIMCGAAYADPVYQDTMTKYYSISPTAFDIEQDGGHSAITYRNHEQLYCQGQFHFMAPVFLPDSSRVIEFRVWVHDTDPDHDIPALLVRTSLDFGTHEIMAQVTSQGNTGNQELIDATIENSLINNAAYTYSVAVVPWANDFYHYPTWFCSMRITYFILSGVVNVDDFHSSLNPTRGTMVESYPIPFSDETNIGYHIQNSGRVTIKVYDEVGRLVRLLVDSTMPKGSYTTRWDGKDCHGQQVTDGPYFCIIRTNGASTTKLICIR